MLIGSEMIMDDPVNVVIAHICECHIVALQKRQSRIVILKIQRFPHSRRHLIDKTENTVVSAGTVIVHQ